MRFIIILVAFILISISGHIKAQDTTYLDIKKVKTDRQNAQFYRITGKWAYLWTIRDYYYLNDKLEMKCQFSSLHPETKEGECNWYYMDGKMQHTGNFVKNKPKGTHKWYYSSGIQKAEENYVNGIMQGDYKEFFENGRIALKSRMKGGKLDSLTTYYDSNGSKLSQGIYINGKKKGVWTFWNKDGKEIGKQNYKTQYKFEDCELEIEFPNNEWTESSPRTGNKVKIYQFQRNPIECPEGNRIFPSTNVIVEDLDSTMTVSKYAELKRKNVPYEIEKTLSFDKGDYKIQNALGYIGTFIDKNSKSHKLYILYLVNNNKGVQLIMDMPTSIFADYENEFKDVLLSAVLIAKR